jgi:cyclohexyl-isocyanide hydratase
VAEQAKFTIGMLLFPDLTQLDFTGPYEVFARMPNTRIYLLAKTLDPIRSERGLMLLPDTRLADAPQVDILFVPGGAGVNPLMEDPETLNFLRNQAKQARYITSVCTGALVLGAAGLLDGYRATTHWLSMDLLEIFGAQPDSERVVIDRNRITGGGITAGIDFGLVIAAELFGEATAQDIQLMLEYDPKPPFQSGSPAVADPALVQVIRMKRQKMQDTRREIAERAASTLRSAQYDPKH